MDTCNRESLFRKEVIYDMTLNFRVAIIATIIATSFALASYAVYAQGNSSGSRPGWGFGDTNHVHTGPPGSSVHP